MTNSTLRLKRAFDIVAGASLAAATSPIVLTAAFALAIKYKGNPFYTQRRFGKDGVPFTIYKLRTMPKEYYDYIGTSGDQNYKRGLTDFLRRSKIDEIPQFINVIKGDMSLVGPRPWSVLPPQTKPEQPSRLEVKPGMAGLFQLRRCKDVTPIHEILDLDAEYVKAVQSKSPLELLIYDIGLFVQSPIAIIRQRKLLQSGPRSTPE